MRRIMVLLALTGVSLLLLACEPEGLRLQVSFDRIDGLKKGSPVRFEGNSVGQVEEVVYTKAGDYLVALTVDKAFANACTTHTRFRIAPLETSGNAMAVVMIQGRPGGDPLTADSKIQGEPMAPSVALGITAELFKGLEKLGEQIETFTHEFQNFEESPAYKRLKEELGALSESMADAGRSAREKIEKEVLPRIEAEIRDLRKRLESMGRESEIAPLEEELKRIKNTV
ncbi:MAG: MlaD family protein [Desulfosarcinaceae bacterium]